MGALSGSHQNLTNLTITASQGTTNHGNQRLLCTPAKWTDVLSFFLSNYFTHVATVVTHPGEAGISTALALTSALLLPTAGVSRGLTAIVRRAKFAKSPLEIAAHGGALCMVVRSDTWTFRDRDVVSDAILRGPLVRHEVILDKYQQKFDNLGRKMITRMIGLPSFFAVPREALEQKLQGTFKLDSFYRWKADDPTVLRLFWPPWASTDFKYWRFYDTREGVVDKRRTIHGSNRLVEGYELAYVPSDAVVLPNSKDKGDESTDAISANYSLPKALVAIIQLLFAISTLFEASGPQIAHYGYAAFALTVTPYAVMSFINLLGTALTPTYPALYMVHSDIMDEARQRGAEFDGVVGRLVNESLAVRNAAYDCFVVRASFHRRTPVPDGSTDMLQQQAAAESDAVRVFGPTEKKLKRSRPVNLGELPSVVRFTYDVDKRTSYGTRNRSLEHEGIQKQLDGDGFPLCLSGAHTTSTTLLVPICSHFRRRKPRSWIFNPVSFNPISLIPRMRGILTSRHEELPQQITDICSWTVSLLSLTIYGALSHFRNAESTLSERVITMMWLALGIIVGPTFVDYINLLTSYVSDAWGKGSAAENRNMELWTTVIAYLLLPVFGAASVAGFVIVGKMITEWGTCVELY